MALIIIYFETASFTLSFDVTSIGVWQGKISFETKNKFQADKNTCQTRTFHAKLVHTPRGIYYVSIPDVKRFLIGQTNPQ